MEGVFCVCQFVIMAQMGKATLWARCLSRLSFVNLKSVARASLIGSLNIRSCISPLMVSSRYDIPKKISPFPSCPPTASMWYLALWTNGTSAPLE